MPNLNRFFSENRSDLINQLRGIVSRAKKDMEARPEDYIDHNMEMDIPQLDIRLCLDIYQDEIAYVFRTGLVDYDEYHSTVCLASCIFPDSTPSEVLEDLQKQI